MASFESELRDQTAAAAERLAIRAKDRETNIELVNQPGGLAMADTPERVAKRLDRLSRYYAGERLPKTPEEQRDADPEVVAAEALERTAQVEAAPEGAVETAGAALRDAPDVREAAGKVLEKIILTRDFVGVRYLDAGVASARAVGRVNVRDASGRVVGYGTGSLVSPRLLLTNHHVLSDAETAGDSAIEFNFQDDILGQPLHSKLFDFDPKTFFLADKERDFALVAVKGDTSALQPYGFNPLIEAEGKAIIGEYVTIVQHPRGEKKQVALRDNQIVDLPGQFMHYRADTEPGSSGSPVFNDQWEVVALHHASVPAPEHPETGGYLNEGIRISKILKFVGDAALTPAQKALVDEIKILERAPVDGDPPPERTVAPPRPPAEPATSGTVAASDGAVRVTVPLELTIRLGSPSSAATGAGPTAAAAVDDLIDEAIKIDPNYAARTGYGPKFLGDGARVVPLPSLPADLLAKSSVSSQPAAGQPKHVLPYHHYSVVMNKERRLAFFTAVNVDGKSLRRLKREKDKWSLDPRVPAAEQCGEDVYEKNPLDRGHLVRRLDPAWGPTRAAAKLANDDTFHFTNCSPQHEDFNQNKATWAGLEDYILDNAENEDMRASVFSGPVFAADDDEYREVRLPRQFWKVAVMAKQPGGLSATGYLLSQEALIAGLETEEAFSYGAYKTFQVPVSKIEALTRLDFGKLRDRDPLAHQEGTTAGHEIGGPEDLIV